MTAISRSAGSYLGSKPGRKFEHLYAILLALGLLGYMILGKQFALVGVPPLYVGEVLLFLGIAAALRSGCLHASLACLPSLILLVLMAWVASIAATNVTQFGMDTLRDSVVVLYGAFSFIVASLLIAEPARLYWIVRGYSYVAALAVTAAPLSLVLFTISLPPPSLLRTGELAVHLAGAAAFTLLGLRKQSWTWSILLVVAVVMVFAQNRGGTLAFAIPVLIAGIVSGKPRGLFQIVLLAVLFGLVALVANVHISISGDRHIHVDQIIANVSSILSDSEFGNLDGTKEWRLGWWNAIIQYTFRGDYFWTGKGFGPNLAIVDGFLVGTELDAPSLRSPHNAHLTILARSGVPGFLLWVVLLLTWFGMMARNAWKAWRGGELMWARFFVFIACYALAALVDATFDVALEGPMIGIWFWTLVGVGSGASMIFWSSHPERSAYRM